MRYLFKLFILLFLLTSITVEAQNTQQVTAVQFFFNTDPGVGNAGNGAIQNFAGNGIYTQNFNVMLPSNLNPGFNTFFVRVKDEFGRWSPIERSLFYVLDQYSGSSINAYEYYFDNDPGVGNGTLTSVISTTSLNVALNITVPNLSEGFHQLYVRSRNSNGVWSVIEHNMIYVKSANVQTVTAVEYYFDVDPGVGNATTYPVTANTSLNIAANIFTPCLATGNHYLFVRAKDNLGNWSIVEKDTLTITNGIDPLSVSPSGPLSFCPVTPITLSTTNVQGIAYQWLKDGNVIPSATNASYIVTTSGNYSVITLCGSNTITSNVVSVTALTLNTYYRDFDVDTYGDINNTISGCTQPLGYVSNSTDCNDNDVTVHQNVSYYLDADHDQYSPGNFIVACNSPGSNYIINSLGNDCNDADADVHPGAFDIPGNNIDDNCNGQIDEITPCIPGSQMRVDGGTGVINPGDIIPHISNSVTTPVGIPAYANYLIINRGYVPLTIQGYQLEGTGISQFSLVTNPTGVIQPNNGFTVSVKFDPTISALSNVILHIYSDNCGLRDYKFAIMGIAVCGQEGTLGPEINVDGNNNPITDGKNATQLIDATEFAPVILNTAVSHSYTINNSGISTLNISAVTIDGINASDFSVTSQPASSIAPGQHTSMVVRFLSAVSGSRKARVHILSNDCDEPDFDFAVEGSDANYCIPVFQYPVLNAWISNVHFGSPYYLNGNARINNASVATPGGYKDYSDTLFATIGQNDILEYAVTTGGNFYNGVAFLVDWNNDGDFNDANENISEFGTNLLSSYGQPAYGFIDIPQDQPGGRYHVRVICDIAHAAGSLIHEDYCSRTSGEAEDYSLVIIPKWYQDLDADGYGNVNVSIVSATQPLGYVANHGDCNDNDNTLQNTNSFWSIDEDHDQYTTGYAFGTCYSPGLDYIRNSLGDDCDDADASVHDANSAWYLDADQDHYHDAISPVIKACHKPSLDYYNAGILGDDCDDANPNIHPGQPEIIGNNIDDDCNGQTDVINPCTSGPEITVKGYDAEILSGNYSPDQNHYTFYYAMRGMATGIDYRVYNNGNAPLTISSCSISGANAALFSISTNPTGTIQPGNYATLGIRYLSNTNIPANAIVKINNNDCNESSYYFQVQAMVVCSELSGPDINLKGNNIDIADGSNNPDPDNNTEFANVPLNTPTDRIFFIKNTGTQPLHIYGVNIDGINASDFSVSAAPSSTVAAGASTLLVIRFTSSVIGQRKARLHILSDDCDESDFDVALKGSDGSYCIPSFVIPCNDSYIQEVKIGSSANFLNNSGIIDNISGASLTGYTNYTNSFITDINQNENAVYTVMAGGNKRVGISVFIDWNKDGDFDDYKENPVSNGGGNMFSDPNLYYANGIFLMPTDQSGGYYRVRIISDYDTYYPNYSNLGIEPCSSHYGEAEDYTIRVIPRWYQDFDQDGFGNPSVSILNFLQPVGYIADYKDCDDNDFNVHQESYWYLDVDQDQYAALGDVLSCHAPSADYYLTTLGIDCDDSDSLEHAGGYYYYDGDNDLYGDGSNRVFFCHLPDSHYINIENILGDSDCDDTDPAIHDVKGWWFLDADNDYYVNPNVVHLESCHQPMPGYINTGILGNDCNDLNPLANPGVQEVPANGIDDNCNTLTDEPVYCIPVITDPCMYAWIRHVKIGTIDNVWDTLCSPGGYKPVDLYGIVTDAPLGSKQTISVTCTNLDQFVSVYVDYNNNNSFLDQGELVVDNMIVAANSTNSSSFYIPGNVALGYHEFRVISSINPVTDPCASYRGEIEDFHIYVQPFTPASGLNFDGIDDYVAIPDHNNGLIAGISTVEVWINPDQLPSHEAGIVTRPGTLNPYYSLYLNPNGSVGVSYDDGINDNRVVTAAGIITTNNWSHIATTNDGSTIKIFINGILSAQLNNISIASAASTDSLYIGMEGTTADAGRHFEGTIDQLRFWNYVRTDCQIPTYKDCKMAVYFGSETIFGLTAEYDFRQGFVNKSNPSETILFNRTNNYFLNNNVDGVLNHFALSGISSNWEIGTTADWRCFAGIVPHIAVNGDQGLGYLIDNGLNNINNSYFNNDFENIANDSSAYRTFKISSNGYFEVAGQSALHISSVDISGVNAADFTISQMPASVIQSGDFSLLTIHFNPSSLGLKNARINIHSDACDDPDFNFAIAANVVCPQSSATVNVQGNMVEIVYADLTPNVSDFTLIGQTKVDTAIYRTFTITNTGFKTLHISGIATSGIYATDYTISTAPVSIVYSGSNTTFTIKFSPSGRGYRDAVLHIYSDDCNHPDYFFAIRGIGECSLHVAEIEIFGNNTEIIDGASNPATADDSYFGIVSIGNMVSHTFTINNIGEQPLTINSLSVSGTHAADFSITTLPASLIPIGGSSTFVLRYAPSIAGPDNAIMHVYSNDCDETNYDFAVGGTDGTPCTPLVANSCSLGYIQNISMGNINNTSTCGVNGFANYTSQSITASAGETVNFTAFAHVNSFGSIPLSLYIDYTGTGNYDFYTSTSIAYSIGGTEYIVGSFIVPPNVALGNYKMRFILSDVYSPSPCYFANGEAEDYTLNIVQPTFVNLNLKLFIQGFYIGGGLMQPVLSNVGISTNTNECDTITVMLYDQLNLSAPYRSDVVILGSNGNVLIPYPLDVIGNDYYIVIRHRNAMETWSKNPVHFSGTLVTFDFTTP